MVFYIIGSVFCWIFIYILHNIYYRKKWSYIIKNKEEYNPILNVFLLIILGVLAFIPFINYITPIMCSALFFCDLGYEFTWTKDHIKFKETKFYKFFTKKI